MSFGERILDLLAEQGMNQKELAKELNIAYSTLNGYVKGNRQPDYGILIQIAKYFDVTTDYLLGVSEIRHRVEGPLSAKEENLVGTYRQLDSDKQDLLMENAELFRKAQKKNGGRPLRRERHEEYRGARGSSSGPSNEQ